MVGFVYWHVGFCPRDVLAEVGSLDLCLDMSACVHLVVWQRDLDTSGITNRS